MPLPPLLTKYGQHHVSSLGWEGIIYRWNALYYINNFEFTPMPTGGAEDKEPSLVVSNSHDAVTRNLNASVVVVL